MSARRQNGDNSNGGSNHRGDSSRLQLRRPKIGTQRMNKAKVTGIVNNTFRPVLTAKRNNSLTRLETSQ